MLKQLICGLLNFFERARLLFSGGRKILFFSFCLLLFSLPFSLFVIDWALADNYDSFLGMSSLTISYEAYRALQLSLYILNFLVLIIPFTYIMNIFRFSGKRIVFLILSFAYSSLYFYLVSNTEMDESVWFWICHIIYAAPAPFLWLLFLYDTVKTRKTNFISYYLLSVKRDEIRQKRKKKS